MSATDIRNPRISRIVDEIPEGASVLDIGGAKLQDDPSDFTHRYIAGRAGWCVGIDIDAESIDQLPEYDIRHAHAETFDLGEQFDVVVAGEVIEHLARPRDFIERVRGHLVDGGKFILTTPHPWGFVRVREAVARPYRIPEDHVAWYCPETITQLLGRFGFAIETIEFWPAKQPGITRTLYRLGFEKLGSPGFVAVARKPHEFNASKTFHCSDCGESFTHEGVPETCPNCDARHERRWAYGMPSGGRMSPSQKKAKEAGDS